MLLPPGETLGWEQGAVARQDAEDTWDLSCLGHEAPSPVWGGGRCWSQGLWVTSVTASRLEFSPGCSESVTKGASLGWGGGERKEKVVQ